MMLLKLNSQVVDNVSDEHMNNVSKEPPSQRDCDEAVREAAPPRLNTLLQW